MSEALLKPSTLHGRPRCAKVTSRSPITPCLCFHPQRSSVGYVIGRPGPRCYKWLSGPQYQSTNPMPRRLAYRQYRLCGVIECLWMISRRVSHIPSCLNNKQARVIDRFSGGGRFKSDTCDCLEQPCMPSYILLNSNIETRHSLAEGVTGVQERRSANAGTKTLERRFPSTSTTHQAGSRRQHRPRTPSPQPPSPPPWRKINGRHSRPSPPSRPLPTRILSPTLSLIASGQSTFKSPDSLLPTKASRLSPMSSERLATTMKRSPRNCL